MRFRINPKSGKTASSVLMIGILAVSGCDQFKPNGAADTITLLRSGSERACVASDVRLGLRGLILPKASDLGADVSANDAASAIGITALAFDSTTLQAFDKSVGKATCTTYVRVDGITHDLKRFRLSYDVSPSAEDASRVVVTADASDVRAYASQQIGNVIAHQNAEREQEDEAAAADKAQQSLAKTVTAKWLVGTWIKASDDIAACSSSARLTFRADQGVEGLISARWALNRNKLHIVGSSSGETVDTTLVITQADASSFNYEGAEAPLKRCAKSSTIPPEQNLGDNIM